MIILKNKSIYAIIYKIIINFIYFENILLVVAMQLTRNDLQEY